MWNRRAEIEMSMKMQVKHLQQQVEAFRSGKKYQRMEAAYAALLQSPVMHADATNARYNGIHANIYVCAAPDGTVPAR